MTAQTIYFGLFISFFILFLVESVYYLGKVKSQNGGLPAQDNPSSFPAILTIPLMVIIIIILGFLIYIRQKNTPKQTVSLKPSSVSPTIIPSSNPTSASAYVYTYPSVSPTIPTKTSPTVIPNITFIPTRKLTPTKFPSATPVKKVSITPAQKLTPVVTLIPSSSANKGIVMPKMPVAGVIGDTFKLIGVAIMTLLVGLLL